MKLFKKKEAGYVDLEKHMSKQENKLRTMKSYKPSEDGTVDLSGQLPQETIESVSDTESVPEVESQSSGGGFFGGFFGGGSSTSSQDSELETQNSTVSETKRRKVSEAIRELTNRIEEQDNEIFKLKQRLEVLERKSRIDY